MTGVEHWEEPMTNSYARDIKPKFRPGDVTCMARAHVKLADATWMCGAKKMPPDGAWPQDWLDTYRNWMDTGFQP
jgi:hypothetical protein